MARTSKKAGKVPELIWKAGIYARLSVDSSKNKSKNNSKNDSIKMQIQIAEEYINRADDIELAGRYTDLGKTGRNFEREGFERMMEDVRRKKINCIVVKDFSRFGRNYIETGNYIEKIFPFMKVRFIAVTDHYDSEHAAGDNDRLSMNLKNIVNELYAKDISQRVKTVKKLNREAGGFTGGVPPYGYRVEKNGNRAVLVPEKDTKDIAAWIYEMYAGGSTYKEIAEELYKKRVQRPAAYHASGKVYCAEHECLQQWPYDTIRRILTNPVYTGTLSAQAGCTAAVHTHEQIVSEELFYTVAQRFAKQGKYAGIRGSSADVLKSEDIFKAKVYCGECGCRLVRNSTIKTLAGGDRVRSYYYSCPNKRRIDGSACKSQGISLKKLTAAAKAALEKDPAVLGLYREAYEKEKREAQKEAEKKKAEYLQEKRKFAVAGSRWYLAYREGTLSREAFLDKKNRVQERIEELEELEQANQTNQIREFEGKEELSYLIKFLVKRIKVSRGHHVELILNDPDTIRFILQTVRIYSFAPVYALAGALQSDFVLKI